jgi:HlyD family secretion protein
MRNANNSRSSQAQRWGWFFVWPLLLVLLSGAPIRAESKPDTKRGAGQVVKAKGTLEPEDLVDVGAQVSGQIVRVLVDFNSLVRTGDVLAQIDDSLYKARLDKVLAQLQVSRANLKVAEVQLARAMKERDRAKKLLEKSAISQEDYDAAILAAEVSRAQLDVVKAQVAEVEAQVKEAKINLDYTVIRAPVAGVVLDRRVNVGQTVATGLSVPSLFLIARDLKRLQVWASVPEADIGHIRKEQSATFKVSAFPDKDFEGVVSQIRLNATMKGKVVTYTVVVDVDNADGKLLPYLTADVTFNLAADKER